MVSGFLPAVKNYDSPRNSVQQISRSLSPEIQALQCPLEISHTPKKRRLSESDASGGARRAKRRIVGPRLHAVSDSFTSQPSAFHTRLDEEGKVDSPPFSDSTPPSHSDAAPSLTSKDTLFLATTQEMLTNRSRITAPHEELSNYGDLAIQIASPTPEEHVAFSKLPYCLVIPPLCSTCKSDVRLNPLSFDDPQSGQSSPSLSCPATPPSGTSPELGGVESPWLSEYDFMSFFTPQSGESDCRVGSSCSVITPSSYTETLPSWDFWSLEPLLQLSVKHPLCWTSPSSTTSSVAGDSFSISQLTIPCNDFPVDVRNQSLLFSGIEVPCIDAGFRHHWSTIG